MKAYATILHNFIDIVRIYKVDRPPPEVCRKLSSALVNIVIELTALTKESFSLNYDKIAKIIKFTVAKPEKQKVV